MKVNRKTDLNLSSLNVLIELQEVAITPEFIFMLFGKQGVHQGYLAAILRAIQRNPDDYICDDFLQEVACLDWVAKTNDRRS